MLDKLKNIGKNLGIVEEVNKGTTQNVVPSSNPIPQNPQQQTVIAPSIVYGVGNTPVEDPEVRQRIFVIFEDAKKKSGVVIDYLDFKKAVDKMKNNPLPDKDKFRAILDVLNSTSNLDLNILSNSIQQYVSILGEEKKQFESAVSSQLEAKLAGINSSIKDKQNLIESLGAKMIEIQKTISDTEIAISNLNAEISTVKNNASIQSAKFLDTLNIVSNELEKDSQIIKTL